MITFNGLLREAGFDRDTGFELKKVQLVRHKDTRTTSKITPYELWSNEPLRFDEYQAIQGRRVFHVGNYLASFVVASPDETLFAGLYRVDAIGTAPKGTACPVSGSDCSEKILYELSREDRLVEYSGLLVIDWGQGHRAWVQRAHKHDKKVLEIRTKLREEPFPGFAHFNWDLNDLNHVPQKWQDLLSKTHGVYLFTCKKTGKQYVGSAKGEDGFWQRFRHYERTKHGGNEGMKRHDTSSMLVSILQRVDTGAEHEIEKIENAWKEKLQSKKFGLNEN